MTEEALAGQGGAPDLPQSAVPAAVPASPPRAASEPSVAVTPPDGRNTDPQPTAHQERLAQRADEIAQERAQSAEELRRIGEREAQ